MPGIKNREPLLARGRLFCSGAVCPVALRGAAGPPGHAVYPPAVHPAALPMVCATPAVEAVFYR